MKKEIKISNNCNHNETCRVFCEENAIIQVGDHFFVDSLSCTLCSICLDVCPTNAITLKESGFQLES